MYEGIMQDESDEAVQNHRGSALCAQKFCILPQGIEGVVDNVEAIGGGT